MSFQTPDLRDRQTSASAAKKALLEKFRAAAEDPNRADREAERRAIAEARDKRNAEREAARKAREAELAAEAARKAELAAKARAEQDELDRLIALEKA